MTLVKRRGLTRKTSSLKWIDPRGRLFVFAQESYCNIERKRSMALPFFRKAFNARHLRK